MTQGTPAIEIVDGKLPCSSCKEWLELDKFYQADYVRPDGRRRTSVRKCGYSSACKACQSKWFKDRPEARRKQIQQALEWQKNHPEQWQAIRARRAAKIASEKALQAHLLQEQQSTADEDCCRVQPS